MVSRRPQPIGGNKFAPEKLRKPDRRRLVVEVELSLYLELLMRWRRTAGETFLADADPRRRKGRPIGLVPFFLKPSPFRFHRYRAHAIDLAQTGSADALIVIPEQIWPDASYERTPKQ